MKDFAVYCDKDLMLEIKAGNKLAFDALYRRYIKKLYKFACSITKSSEEAENIIQNVFLNLWINRNKIEKEASVKCYIFKIVYNSSISFLREKIKEYQFVEYLKTIQDKQEDEIISRIDYEELDKELNKIIDELPDRQKEVILLRKIDGLKYSEISERMNISRNTIENHMSRALKTIRLKLGNYYPLVIILSYLIT